MRRMLVLVLVLSWASVVGAQARYYPERFDWQRRTPEQAATYMQRFCSCGVFNPARAKRILEEARSRQQ